MTCLNKIPTVFYCSKKSLESTIFTTRMSKRNNKKYSIYLTISNNNIINVHNNYNNYVSSIPPNWKLLSQIFENLGNLPKQQI